MTRHKNYHSDFFGTSGYFYNHCTPEEFITKCRNDIDQSEARIRGLLAEKQAAEKQNGNIELVKKASTFAQVGIFAFDALLFLSGHWIWGLLMIGGGNVPVYEGIREIEHSLLSGKYKKDTFGYDAQVVNERKYIEELNKDIKLVEDMLKSRAANGGEYGSHNNAGEKSSTGSRTRSGQNKSDYQQRRNSALDINEYYLILCCSPDASDSEVKTAYRKLAMEYHPDRVSATGLGEHITHDAEEKLKQINEAYRKIMEFRRR